MKKRLFTLAMVWMMVLGITFRSFSIPIVAQEEGTQKTEFISEFTVNDQIVQQLSSRSSEECLDVRDYGHHRYQAREYPPVIIDEYDGLIYHYTVYSQLIECICGKQTTIVYTVRSL